MTKYKFAKVPPRGEAIQFTNGALKVPDHPIVPFVEGDGTGPDGQPQCLSSYRCREGHCTVQCAGHKDCKGGEVCKVGICQKGGAVASCYENRDCIYPETCYYGQCVAPPPTTRCSSDLDCPVGNRCINGLCQ